MRRERKSWRENFNFHSTFMNMRKILARSRAVFRSDKLYRRYESICHVSERVGGGEETTYRQQQTCVCDFYNFNIVISTVGRRTCCSIFALDFFLLRFCGYGTRLSIEELYVWLTKCTLFSFQISIAIYKHKALISLLRVCTSARAIADKRAQ